MESLPIVFLLILTNGRSAAPQGKRLHTQLNKYKLTPIGVLAPMSALDTPLGHPILCFLSSLWMDDQAFIWYSVINVNYAKLKLEFGSNLETVFVISVFVHSGQVMLYDHLQQILEEIYNITLKKN